MDKIKGYKGFNPDLTCRDYKYEIGKEYDTDKAEQCESGFHFCEFPFDVFSYYPPYSEKGEARYAEVEGSGQMDKGQDKISCTHLSIKTEIGLSGIINAGVKFILDKVKWDTDKATNTGYRSAATNTGYQSAATNTGYQSAATNTGNYSAATNTGNYSAATNTQHGIPVSGYQHGIPVSGYQHGKLLSSHQHGILLSSYQHGRPVSGYR